MPYELYIAFRHLKSKKRNGLVSVIAFISITGVVIGVAALIIILSVMNGYVNEVSTRFIGVDSHIRVRRYHNAGISTFGPLMNQIKGVNPAKIVETPALGNILGECSQLGRPARLRPAAPTAMSVRKANDLWIHRIAHCRLNAPPQEG